MAITETYVDPSIAGDSGTGTIGDPYGDVQYALNTMTRDATNGDRINIKAGTAEVLAASLTLATYGTPTGAAPLCIRGYTTAAADGGIGEIDCGGNTMWTVTSYDYIVLVDLELHTFGDNNGVVLDADSLAFRCEVHKGASSPSSKTLLTLSSNEGAVIDCHVHDAGTSGIGIKAQTVLYCYLHDIPGTAIYRPTVSAIGNIVEINDIGALGITIIYNASVIGNTIYSSVAATGSGIMLAADNIWMTNIISNIVEGFSGVGGSGIKITTGSDAAMVGYNAFYNNTTHFTNSGNIIIDETANDVVLGSSPFTNPATGDYSVGTGVKALGYPGLYLGSITTSYMDIGAAQRQEPTGGGGGRRPRIRAHGV